MYLPELLTTDVPRQKQIIDFQGYSQAPMIDDGEMRDMLNLTSDKYPNLYQRPSRGLYRQGATKESPGDVPGYPYPECMIVKDGKLAVITKQADDNDAMFFYGYETSGGTIVPKGYPAVAIDASKTHKMAAVNTRICIWPEKLWFNVETGETGTLDAEFTRTADATDTIVFANNTTTVCTVTYASMDDTEKAAFNKFSAGDAVDIVISNYNSKTYTLAAVIQATSISSNAGVITFPADTFLTVFGETSSVTFNNGGKVKITRYVPDLDFVMESNNRLWGCHDNAICCSKLGDPTNWHYYQGLSVDSYEVQVGTDGKWTGCCAYSSHLLFFKENYIHKVYGGTPSQYQIQQAECYGLERGSEKSICVINETVFYKSKIGIMAYSGSLPEHITSNFGSNKYSNGIAGSDGAKYYISMEKDESEQEGGAGRELLVFDLDKKMWHKEDDLHPVQFAYLTNDQSSPEAGNRNQLLYLKMDDEGNTENVIYSVNPYVPLPDEDLLPWMAELGPFDEIIENKKIYSKLRMRLKLEDKSELTIAIKFNDGEWQEIRHIYSMDDRNLSVPIAPVRCDKFFLRLEGKGRCTVESLVREYRERSDR